MAGATTPQGAAADAAAENSGKSAKTEVSGAGVETAPLTTDKFERVTMYHRNGQERVADTLERKYQLEFDGFRTEKPKQKKS